MPLPAAAVEAHYEAYAAGIEVIDVDASIDVGVAAYRIRLDFRTVGALNLVLRSHQDTTVDGRIVSGPGGERAEPARFFSAGRCGGTGG